LGHADNLIQVEELEAIRRRLAGVRREIVATSARLQELRDEERGLSLSVARLAGSPEQPIASDRAGQGSRHLGKTRITPVVRALLASADRPLTRNEITDQLLEQGLHTSPDTVSASLAYLRKTGVAANMDGRWYPAD